jgi:DNA-binding response OmpR family regulator
MVRVLVVEDEFKMAELLRRGLEEQGCRVEVAYTGHDGLRIARSSTFDVVTLDVMLPGIDGLEVARELRRFRVLTPILFLTARDSKLDIVRGLELGGDDYLTKPFSFLELLARLRALARRSASVPAQKLQVEDLVLDPATLSVTRGGAPVEISPTEFSLLEVLMRNVGSVVLRHALFSGVWGTGRSVENNTLDVYIRMLRRKIDDGQAVRLIHTVRGFGYQMCRRSAL